MKVVIRIERKDGFGDPLQSSAPRFHVDVTSTEAVIRLVSPRRLRIPVNPKTAVRKLTRKVETLLELIEFQAELPTSSSRIVAEPSGRIDVESPVVSVVSVASARLAVIRNPMRRVASVLRLIQTGLAMARVSALPATAVEVPEFAWFSQPRVMNRPREPGTAQRNDFLFPAAVRRAFVPLRSRCRSHAGSGMGSIGVLPLPFHAGSVAGIFERTGSVWKRGCRTARSSRSIHPDHSY